MKEKLLLPVIIICVAALMRIFPHVPNIAPITAMALFGGMYMERKYALILPLVALFLSDLFLGFHNTVVFVYVSFGLVAVLGIVGRERKTIGRVLGMTLFSSLLFFFITNFGVWLVSGMYEKSVQGLITCFTYALPFLRNTLVGDFMYMGLLVGGYEGVRNLGRLGIFERFGVGSK